jgi:undecaprenyl-diphosphatase
MILAESFWYQIIPAWLDRIDRIIFLFVNGKAIHPVFDALVPWWRESITWTPVYFFLLLFVVINDKKNAFPWIAMALVTILLSDQISSSVVKPLFARIRPCNDPNFYQSVRLLLDGCGAGFSFTSSHATNHFALAFFLSITLRDWIKKYSWALFLWAASIGYAQVYAGVHYPLDVIGGAVLGSFIGYVIAQVYQRYIGPLSPQNQTI